MGEKIKESPFATQVVDRVQALLRDRHLAAPSPGANGPADDPNVVGEYLDSTLSSEQAAEVDRRCLESDVHLAEVAACHQVLTMVLGTPADIPPALRQRVYEVGEAHQEDAGAAGATDPTVVRPVVAPVGLDDSGPYQAAGRLEEDADALSLEAAREGEANTARQAALAGSRPLNASEASELFGGRSPLSRAMPWLVTLGLAALLLLVVARVFAPLLESGPVALENESIEASEQAPPSPGAESSRGGVPEESPRPGSEPGAGAGTPVAATGTDASPGSNAETGDRPAGEAADPVTAAPETAGESVAPETGADPESSGPAPPAPAEAAAAEEAMAAEGANTPAPAVAKEADEPVGEPTAGAPAGTPAVLASEGGLLLVAGPKGDQWDRIAAGGSVPWQRTLVCPPLFRMRLSIEDRLEVVMVGPARMQLRGDASEPEIVLERGRLLVSSLTDQLVVGMQLASVSGILAFPELGDVAAVEVSPYRVPGADPTNAENSLPVVQLGAVAGRLGWVAGDRESRPIETGQRWSQVGSQDPQVRVPAEVAEWIEPPEASRQTLQQAARQGLLAFLDQGKPVELALREAVGFRRAEVGALAARTLLLMGEAKVYFGGEGVLSDPDQRSYWAEHVAALRARMNEGPEAARQIKEAAAAMDGASAETLFRLLWGYSPEQLQAGADAFLVEMLDSPQMALRVLAIENLRQITGTSLFYKAEQENQSRRRSEVKKWETRLRRGDIRWETIPMPL